MKSILFEVDNNSVKNVSNTDPNTNNQYQFVISIDLPLLPAYSVEHVSLNINGLSSPLTREDKINGSTIKILSQYPTTISDQIIILLHSHGIRDYSLLFPTVADLNLRLRLGQFYEEAEKNFEQGSWLSFALMCGAVFEGMLHAKLSPISSRNTFANMIEDALSQNIINGNQRDIMNIVRNSRNLVHANRINNPYISRKNAMDIRTTLDMLIKDFSF